MAVDGTPNDPSPSSSSSSSPLPTPASASSRSAVGKHRGASYSRMRTSSDVASSVALSLAAAAEAVYTSSSSNGGVQDDTRDGPTIGDTIENEAGIGSGKGRLTSSSTSSLNTTDNIPFPRPSNVSSSSSTFLARPNPPNRILSDSGPSSPSRRNHQQYQNPTPADERTPLLSSADYSGTQQQQQPHRQRAQSLRSARGTRSVRSISISTTDGPPDLIIPIPPYNPNPNPISTTTSTPKSSNPFHHMFRSQSHPNIPIVRRVETQGGEVALVVTRPRKKRHWFVRYTRCLLSRDHWGALFHLVFLNAPFAILLWPFLVVGTLAGTILLITLPIGAITWFLVLMLSRSACRLELAMQIYFHSPLRSSIPRPVYFPIFKRIKVVDEPNGIVRPVVEVTGEGDGVELSGVVWENNFFQNAWSLFSDHTSYQCLSYLILTKAIVTLISTIGILVIVPVSFVLIVPFPGVLELVRRFGRWQAGVAVESLQ